MNAEVRAAPGGVFLKEAVVLIGEVVARGGFGDMVVHELVNGAADVLDQLRVRLHLLDGRVDDRLEGTLYERRYEAGKIDRADHGARRAGGPVRGAAAARRRATRGRAACRRSARRRSGWQSRCI